MFLPLQQAGSEAMPVEDVEEYSKDETEEVNEFTPGRLWKRHACIAVCASVSLALSLSVAAALVTFAVHGASTRIPIADSPDLQTKNVIVEKDLENLRNSDMVFALISGNDMGCHKSGLFIKHFLSCGGLSDGSSLDDHQVVCGGAVSPILNQHWMADAEKTISTESVRGDDDLRYLQWHALGGNALHKRNIVYDTDVWRWTQRVRVTWQKLRDGTFTLFDAPDKNSGVIGNIRPIAQADAVIIVVSGKQENLDMVTSAKYQYDDQSISEMGILYQKLNIMRVMMRTKTIGVLLDDLKESAAEFPKAAEKIREVAARVGFKNIPVLPQNKQPWWEEFRYPSSDGPLIERESFWGVIKNLTTQPLAKFDSSKPLVVSVSKYTDSRILHNGAVAVNVSGRVEQGTLKKGATLKDPTDSYNAFNDDINYQVAKICHDVDCTTGEEVPAGTYVTVILTRGATRDDIDGTQRKTSGVLVAEELATAGGVKSFVALVQLVNMYPDMYGKSWPDISVGARFIWENGITRARVKITSITCKGEKIEKIERDWAKYGWPEIHFEVIEAGGEAFVVLAPNTDFKGMSRGILFDDFDINDQVTGPQGGGWGTVASVDDECIRVGSNSQFGTCGSEVGQRTKGVLNVFDHYIPNNPRLRMMAMVKEACTAEPRTPWRGASDQTSCKKF